MEPISFTRNYNDLSTREGYQFDFFCDKCGKAHRSPFDRDSLETGKGLLRAAGSIFGGAAASFATAADQATGQHHRAEAKDRAFAKAVQAVGPSFAQCGRCGMQVCADTCFNPQARQCTRCAPAATDSPAPAGAAPTPPPQRMGCPTCRQFRPGGRFCAECGTPLVVVQQGCAGCGSTQNPDGARFCMSCGTALA